MIAWVYQRNFLQGSESAESTSEIQNCRSTIRVQFSEENFEPMKTIQKQIS
jgi:hypothetical protein